MGAGRWGERQTWGVLGEYSLIVSVKRNRPESGRVQYTEKETRLTTLNKPSAC